MSNIIRPFADGILGAPGSGKDTQADLLNDLYWQFSTGKMMRALPEAERQELINQMTGGALAADESTFRFVDREFPKFYNNRNFDIKGLLLNGLPRKISQVEETLKRFDLQRLIALSHITNEELFERLWNRELKNPRGETKDVIWGRLQTYQKETAPVPEYLQRRHNVKIIRVDATNDIEEVQREIREKLQYK